MFIKVVVVILGYPSWLSGCWVAPLGARIENQWRSVLVLMAHAVINTPLRKIGWLVMGSAMLILLVISCA